MSIFAQLEEISAKAPTLGAALSQEYVSYHDLTAARRIAMYHHIASWTPPNELDEQDPADANPVEALVTQGRKGSLV